MAIDSLYASLLTGKPKTAVSTATGTNPYSGTTNAVPKQPVYAPPPTTSITSSTIQPPTQPLAVPAYNPPPPVNAAPPGALTQQQMANAKTPEQLRAADPSLAEPVKQAPIDFGVSAAQAEEQRLQEELAAAFGLQGTQTARRQQLEADSGLLEASQRSGELYDIDAGYAADLAQIAAQRLQGQVSQQGTPTGELGRSINLKDLNYNAIVAEQNVNIKRAVNSIAIAAADRKMANAQNYVERALALEFEPLKAKIEYLTTFYNKNADRLDARERAQLQYQIDQQQQTYEAGITSKKQIYDTLALAGKNGAPAEVLRQISQATTPEEAVMAAGQFMADAGDSKLQFISGTANQPSGVFNPATGQFTPTGGGGGAGTPGAPSQYQTSTAQRTLESVVSLKEKAADSPGIFGATAALPVPDFLRTSAYRNFKSELDTLKANIGFGALNEMREASKTGGALGNVSDREVALLSSTLGALNMSQSPENFQQQLLKIEQSIQRWQAAVNTFGAGGGSSIEDLRTKYGY